MGQSPQSTHHNYSRSGNQHYEMDVRLLEFINIVPSAFSSSTSKVIQEIEQLRSKVQSHPLENYLTTAIDQHFSKYNQINLQALVLNNSIDSVLGVDSTKFNWQEWNELSNKQIFLGLLQHFQELYQVERQIGDVFASLENIKNSNSNDRNVHSILTFRKQIAIDKPKQQLDEGLLIRLIYHYYLILLKNNANSGEKAVFRFHDQTGRLLCFMVFFGYLNLQQLFELFYMLVYMDKHGGRSIRQKLDIVNKMYHYDCLKNTFTINVEQKQLRIIQTATRLYLDELYLKSIKDAEDPDIPPTDDTLMPIKVFPISKVKEKTKN